MSGMRRSGLAFTLVCALMVALAPAQAAEKAGPALLARSVPADTRLYLEFHGFDSLSATPLGQMIARLAGSVLTSNHPAEASRPSETQPTTQSSGWRQWFTQAVGLANPKAADLLFTGPVAFAAEGWSGIGDAILLAEPKDPAAFEAAMASQRGLVSPKVKQYNLSHEHALACDGHTVVIGRGGPNVNMYHRTVALWESNGGAALGEMAEFRERMAGLPADVQVVFYAGSSSRSGESQLLMGQWWPESWSGLHSLALGAGLNLSGLTLDVNGRMEPDENTSATPPLAADALKRLPASVVVAWTQPVDFVDSVRRLMASDPDGILQSLFADMPGGSIEGQLLRHFVGSAVFVVAEAPMPPPPGVPHTATAPVTPATQPAVPATASSPAATTPASAPRPTSRASVPTPASSPGIAPLSPPLPSQARKPVSRESGLILPGLAMLVETDDPHAVEAALDRLTLNLQYLVATRTASDFASVVHRHSDSAGGRIVSVSLGSFFAASTECPFLQTLEFSWIIWDRWLIIGSNTETVRQIVAARRGQGPLLPSASATQQEAEFVRTGSPGQMLLVAQPRLLAVMLDSWVTYVTTRYPDMLKPEWWRQLERRQRSMRVQLGVVPTSRDFESAIEVGQTLPDYPAFGVLQPGDLILGVDGRALSADDPSGSLRQMLALASESGQVTLRISRAGIEQDVLVEMPGSQSGDQPVDPVRLIEQAARFLRPFPSAVYAVWHPGPDLLKAHLQLQFTAATQPAK